MTQDEAAPGDRSLADWLGEATDDTPPTGAGAPRMPPWADDEAGAPPARARRLWLLAIVPWLLVGTLLALRAADGNEPAAAEPAEWPTSTSGSRPATLPDDGPGDERPPASASEGGQVRTPVADRADLRPDGVPDEAVLPDPPGGATADPLLAFAVTAVHAAVTGSTPEGADTYVDHVVAERVTWVDETAVVTVLAIVLEGADGVWRERRAARFAAPVRHDGEGPRLLAAPWPLPGPDLAPVEQTGEREAIGDAHEREAAITAIEDAGYVDVRLDDLARAGADGVLVARVEAVPPDASAATVTHVWLTDHPTPTVLGLGRSASVPGPAAGEVP